MIRNLILVSLLLNLHASIAKAEDFWTRYLPPSEQGEQRKEKMFAVGLPLSNPYNLPSHFQLRLGKQFLLGGSFAISDENDEDEGDDEDTVAGEFEYNAAGYELKAKMHIASAYVEYYPSKKSGFHIGFGAESRWGSYTETLIDGNETRTTAKGNFHGIYMGPSFGWSWIWDNGLIFGFDISKRARQGSKINSTPLSSRASANTIDVAEKKYVPESVPGMVMLGYSF